jgi:hypothetical protein
MNSIIEKLIQVPLEEPFILIPCGHTIDKKTLLKLRRTIYIDPFSHGSIEYLNVLKEKMNARNCPECQVPFTAYFPNLMVREICKDLEKNKEKYGPMKCNTDEIPTAIPIHVDKESDINNVQLIEVNLIREQEQQQQSQPKKKRKYTLSKQGKLCSICRGRGHNKKRCHATFKEHCIELPGEEIEPFVIKEMQQQTKEPERVFAYDDDDF